MVVDNIENNPIVAPNQIDDGVMQDEDSIENNQWVPRLSQTLVNYSICTSARHLLKY